MRELIRLEEFKNQLPEKIGRNEQKVVSLAAAAVLADEFVLTHKSVFYLPVRHDPVAGDIRVKSPSCSSAKTTDNRECYYCREQGQLMVACPSLKRKEQHTSRKTPSPIGCIQTNRTP